MIFFTVIICIIFFISSLVLPAEFGSNVLLACGMITLGCFLFIIKKRFNFNLTWNKKLTASYYELTLPLSPKELFFNYYLNMFLAFVLFLSVAMIYLILVEGKKGLYPFHMILICMIIVAFLFYHTSFAELKSFWKTCLQFTKMMFGLFVIIVSIFYFSLVSFKYSGTILYALFFCLIGTVFLSFFLFKDYISKEQVLAKRFYFNKYSDSITILLILFLIFSPLKVDSFFHSDKELLSKCQKLEARKPAQEILDKCAEFRRLINKQKANPNP